MRYRCPIRHARANVTCRCCAARLLHRSIRPWAARSACAAPGPRSAAWQPRPRPGLVDLSTSHGGVTFKRFSYLGGSWDDRPNGSMDMDYNAPHEMSFQVRYGFDGKYAGLAGAKAMRWYDPESTEYRLAVNMPIKVFGQVFAGLSDGTDERSALFSADCRLYRLECAGELRRVRSARSPLRCPASADSPKHRPP